MTTPLAKADYTAALRRYLGPEGRFRIERDGTIHAKVGAWIVFGRIGEARTFQTLFGDGPRPKGAATPATAAPCRGRNPSRPAAGNRGRCGTAAIGGAGRCCNIPGP